MAMSSDSSRFSSYTVNKDEVEKFHQQASSWWQSAGPFSVLRAMNAVRVPFIRDGILLSASSERAKTPKPLHGYSILDVGSGGGFLAEPLARLGACVTGLDPSSENVRVATEHASLDTDLKDRLKYVCGSVESFEAGSEKFDAIVCSEVIEHVDNQEFFVERCAEFVKENGSLFFTTLNRTTLSYMLGIVAAEYVLGIVPKGTHQWEKFITPSELESLLERAGCHTLTVQGMLYNPLTANWSWFLSTECFYALHAVKKLPVDK